MCLDQKLLNISYIMRENSGSYIIAMMPLDTCSIFCLIQNTILDYVQAIDGDSDNPRQIIYQFTNSKFCQLIHQQESLFLAVSLWTKFKFLNSTFFLFLCLQCMLYIGYLIMYSRIKADLCLTKFKCHAKRAAAGKFFC